MKASGTIARLRDQFMLRQCALAAALLWPAAAALAGDSKQIMGLYDLADRIGEENLPTGQSVHVAQAEGLQGGNYRPDPNHSQFAGKQFQWMSGGSTAPSAHATSVGSLFYGSSSALVPGITVIHSYNASPFLQSDWLRANFAPTVPPLAPPGQTKIVNHSWVGDAQSMNNAVLRRADFVMDTYDLLMVAGVHNSSSSYPLLTNGFNGLAVGRVSGEHGSGPTVSSVDVPGRMKPEIVAPAGSTSSATPMVASAAAMMVDVARTEPSLMGNPRAERSDIIKAILLAGARHEADWTNEPVTEGPERGIASQPLDDTFGAGTVNVNRSHMILTGNQQPGSEQLPSSAVAHAGWDRPQLLPQQHRYWRFSVPKVAVEVSIVATWNRQVHPSNMDAWFIGHFELELWRVVDGTLQSLVGDAGVGVYESGNIISNSPIDNIQHLFVRGLEPGDYALEVRRTDTHASPWPVAVAWLFPQTSQPEVLGDLNSDGSVDVADLLILLSWWGDCPAGPCEADLNEDLVVDVSDLLVLLAHWG